MSPPYTEVQQYGTLNNVMVMPLKICDRIIFDYYTGLACIHSNKPYPIHNTAKQLYLFVYEAQ